MSKMCCINFNLYIPYDLSVQRMKSFGYYCRSTKKNKVHGNKYRERKDSTRAIACAASCLPQYSSVLPGIIRAVQNIEINNSGFNTFIDGTIFLYFYELQLQEWGSEQILYQVSSHETMAFLQRGRLDGETRI